MSFYYNAVILSAGESSRMGFYPKALLRLQNGRTFLEEIIYNLSILNEKPQEIITVLGFHYEKIIKDVDLSKCRVIFNPHPELGMLSSIKEAIGQVPAKSHGILLCLVDHPKVMPETYANLIDAARQNPGRIIIPVCGNRKGHPVFFPHEIFKDIILSPPDQGARWAVQKNSEIIIFMETYDEGIFIDIDTEEEFRKHLL